MFGDGSKCCMMRMADAAAIIGSFFAKVLLTRKPTNERNMSVSVPRTRICDSEITDGEILWLD